MPDRPVVHSPAAAPGGCYRGDMNDESTTRPVAGAHLDAARAWERPRFEVVPLDCEITAYAPDGDDPLF